MTPSRRISRPTVLTRRMIGNVVRKRMQRHIRMYNRPIRHFRQFLQFQLRTGHFPPRLIDNNDPNNRRQYRTRDDSYYNNTQHVAVIKSERFDLNATVSLDFPQRIVQMAFVRTGIGLDRVHDHDEHVLGGEEVPLRRHDNRAVLQPRDRRRRHALRHALQHHEVAGRHLLVLHRLGEVRLLLDGQRGVRDYSARRIVGSAAVDARVDRFRVHDEEFIVARHHVHATLAGRREIVPAEFVPLYLGRRFAVRGAEQFRCLAHLDGHVFRDFGERWIDENGNV